MLISVFFAGLIVGTFVILKRICRPVIKYTLNLLNILQSTFVSFSIGGHFALIFTLVFLSKVSYFIIIFYTHMIL